MKHIIIDGNNNMWRFYSIYKNFRKKYPGIFGMLNFYLSLLNKFGNNCKYYFIWDCGKDKQRLLLYKNYKKKEVSPEKKMQFKEVIAEINLLENFLKKLPVYTFKIPGEEGDDIVASLVCLIDGEKIIVSTDRDFYQLVRDDVSVYNPVKDVFCTELNFKDINGVSKDKFLFYRALIGDNSDNIKGVYGIGPKKAEFIVNNVSLEDIEKETVDKKFKYILDYKDIIFLNMKLMKLYSSKDLCEKVGNILKQGVPLFDKNGIEKMFWTYDMMDIWRYFENLNVY